MHPSSTLRKIRSRQRQRNRAQGINQRLRKIPYPRQFSRNITIVETQGLRLQLGPAGIKHAQLLVQRHHVLGHHRMHLQLAYAMHQTQRKNHVGVEFAAVCQPACSTGGIQVVAPELMEIHAVNVFESTRHATAEHQVTHHHKAQHLQCRLHRANGSRDMKISRIGQSEQLGAQRRISTQLCGNVADRHFIRTETGNQLLTHFGNGRQFAGLIDEILKFHWAG
ncbi:hypothetical protein GALL_486400 [mine drainage metagenome]|uniref:Uncharacterized protein n=1 Tax=mine drainage metagenome TaxID=410659 RepID=A0A1J5PEV3_9ZZZZ